MSRWMSAASWSVAGWTTWSEAVPPNPNRAVRNLGAPVPDEHGEYWENQQEFVPLLVRKSVLYAAVLLACGYSIWRMMPQMMPKTGRGRGKPQ